jgi:hypothetical protein
MTLKARVTNLESNHGGYVIMFYTQSHTEKVNESYMTKIPFSGLLLVPKGI